MTALVTSAGTVRSIEVSHVRPDEGATGARTVRFGDDRVGDMAVDPSWWYDEARRATETGRENGPTPTGGPDCGGVGCEEFPGGEAVGKGRCVG